MRHWLNRWIDFSDVNPDGAWKDSLKIPAKDTRTQTEVG
jgi:hypothetical protein